MKMADRRRTVESKGAASSLSLVVEQDQTSLREKTVMKLREAIIAGYFKPGEQLVERDICAKTDVSRTSLREAFRHLETEGLVESRKGHGVFVKFLSVEDVRDIYELRMALDPEAARRFSERAGATHRARLSRVVVQLLRIPYDDRERARSANNEFYEVIYEGSGSRLSLGIMKSLQSRMSLLRAITLRSSSKQRHLESMRKMAQIAAEIEKGSPEKAAKLCRDFAARSLKFALATLADLRLESGGPREARQSRRSVS